MERVAISHRRIRGSGSAPTRAARSFVLSRSGACSCNPGQKTTCGSDSRVANGHRRVRGSGSAPTRAARSFVLSRSGACSCNPGQKTPVGATPESRTATEDFADQDPLPQEQHVILSCRGLASAPNIPRQKNPRTSRGNPPD